MHRKHLVSLALPLAFAAVAALVSTESHASAPVAPPITPAAGGPLSAWMTGNATPALAHADFAKLAYVFEHIAQSAPRQPGFERWTAIARDGLAASARHDVEGARRACKECHDTMRAEYKKAQRANER